MAKLATLDSPQFSVLCSLCGNKSYGQLLGAQRRIKRRWKKPSLFSLSRHSTRHTHMLPSLSLPSISHHQPSTFFSPSFFLVVDGIGDRCRRQKMHTARGFRRDQWLALRVGVTGSIRTWKKTCRSVAVLGLQLGLALVWELPHLTFMLGTGCAPFLVTALDKLWQPARLRLLK